MTHHERVRERVCGDCRGKASKAVHLAVSWTSNNLGVSLMHV